MNQCAPVVMKSFQTLIMTFGKLTNIRFIVQTISYVATSIRLIISTFSDEDADSHDDQLDTNSSPPQGANAKPV